LSNQCRVVNSEGETVATGACEINEERQEVTLRPLLDSGLIDKEMGPLFLEMDDGGTLELSSRFMKFRLYGTDGERESIYRLRYQTRQEARGSLTPR
jgi:hypothetical protein